MNDNFSLSGIEPGPVYASGEYPEVGDLVEFGSRHKRYVITSNDGDGPEYRLNSGTETFREMSISMARLISRHGGYQDHEKEKRPYSDPSGKAAHWEDLPLEMIQAVLDAFEEFEKEPVTWAGLTDEERGYFYMWEYNLGKIEMAEVVTGQELVWQEKDRAVEFSDQYAYRMI